MGLLIRASGKILRLESSFHRKVQALASEMTTRTPPSSEKYQKSDLFAIVMRRKTTAALLGIGHKDSQSLLSTEPLRPSWSRRKIHHPQRLLSDNCIEACLLLSLSSQLISSKLSLARLQMSAMPHSYPHLALQMLHCNSSSRPTAQP